MTQDTPPTRLKIRAAELRENDLLLGSRQVVDNVIYAAGYKRVHLKLITRHGIRRSAAIDPRTTLTIERPV